MARLKLKPLKIRFFGIKITIGLTPVIDWLIGSLKNDDLWERVVTVLEQKGLPHKQAVEVADWVRGVLLIEFAQAE